MLDKKDKGLIISLLNHCNKIISKTNNISEKEFYKDEDLQEIIAFHLLQIGELVSKFTTEFLNEFNVIPWKQIKALRNRIFHGYDTIDIVTIWESSIFSVKELKNYIEEIL